MYKVIRAFFDSKDNNRLYNVGDIFPMEGVKAPQARVKALLDGTNKNGKVYLEEIPDSEGGPEGAPGDKPGDNLED